MKTSERGVKHILDEERCVLHIYKDPVGKPTIGVGHLIRPGEVFPQTITKERAAELLATDLARFEAAVERRITVPLNQNQFDALVSLCFNCGEKPLLQGVGKMLNAGEYARAADKLLEWKFAGDPPRPILLERRKRERALFLEPVAEVPPAIDAEQVLAMVGATLDAMRSDLLSRS